MWICRMWPLTMTLFVDSLPNSADVIADWLSVIEAAMHAEYVCKCICSAVQRMRRLTHPRSSDLRPVHGMQTRLPCTAPLLQPPSSSEIAQVGPHHTPRASRTHDENMTSSPSHSASLAYLSSSTSFSNRRVQPAIECPHTVDVSINFVGPRTLCSNWLQFCRCFSAAQR
ncbi:hypothetical protein DFH27DRAFT_13050 [Peziza echinospora]|nr:hypothetical protein DFH27DRAFT_13050 [Peziza echinospora]